MSPADEWWQACETRCLLVQRCDACGRHQHYPRSICSHCGRTGALAWTEAAGTGVLDTFTVVHRAPRPDVEVPYVVARVRLTEGPVLLTSLVDVGVADVQCGQPVVLRWRDRADAPPLPVFTPIPTTED